MARKDKVLEDPFEKFGKKEEENSVDNDVSLNNQSVNETDDDAININNKVEHKNDSEILNINTEHSDDSVNMNNTIEQVTLKILNNYEVKKKKETVEDTHTRTTFLLRKDLSKRLDKLSKGKRGFKQHFLNDAVEILLNGLEKQ